MRQIAAFSVGTFIGIAMLITLVHFQEGIPTSSSKWAHDLYRVKESHAAKSHSQKLLIVAGSNSLFGLDAAQIERKYQLPTTNFGVHAGLGLRYILDRSKRSLRPGDIVYLPLEYALYQQEPAPSTQLMDFILARDPAYLHSLPLLEQFLGYTNVSFERIIEGLRGGNDNYMGSSSSTYNVANVDSSGNQLNNSSERAADYKDKLDKLQAKDIGNGDISGYSKKVLGEFFIWAKENDVCVIGAPPNLLKFDEYDADRFVNFVTKIRNFYLENDTSFIGNPTDYLLPKKMFFDTEYHLNEIGVATRTRLTLNDLGDQLTAHCVNQPR
ncbi:hypothetical protein [Microbulbifer hydrolyticus]|nr:hypothetical protein [Microbulbifer hydrolyticus]